MCRSPRSPASISDLKTALVDDLHGGRQDALPVPLGVPPQWPRRIGDREPIGGISQILESFGFHVDPQQISGDNFSASCYRASKRRMRLQIGAASAASAASRSDGAGSSSA